jgi:hypothetical protein
LLVVREQEFLLDSGSVSERIETSKESDVATGSGDSSRSNFLDVELFYEIGLLSVGFLSIILHVKDGESVELCFLSELLSDNFGGRSAVLASRLSPLHVILLAVASSILVDDCVLINATKAFVWVLLVASATVGTTEADGNLDISKTPGDLVHRSVKVIGNCEVQARIVVVE